MNSPKGKIGRPARKIPVIKTAWYATNQDIDNINRLRVELFSQFGIQANTNTDVISIVLQKYADFLGIKRAYGKKKV